MGKTTINTNMLGDGVLNIGSNTSLHNLGNQVTSVKLVPKADSSDGVTVVTGLKKGGARKVSWTLEGKFLFDAGTADSTSDFLFDHRGEEMPFTFTPSKKYKRTYTGKVVIESSEIGGNADEDNQEVDFSFNVIGEPSASNAQSS